MILLNNNLLSMHAALANKEITVIYCELESNKSLCLEKGRVVAIDETKFRNEAEQNTALIHEEGHFDSGAFYHPYSKYETMSRAEERAWRSAYKTHIPFEELKEQIRSNKEIWEIAEHFNVTIGCIWGAYLYYKEARGMTF